MRGLSEVSMGIGVATGEVIVGNIGSERRSHFTAIGRPVNLAARLEAHAGGGETLIAPNTYEEVQSVVTIATEREIAAKGFDAPVLARTVSEAAQVRPGQGNEDRTGSTGARATGASP
jgi:adenylate cyclase